MPFEMYGSFETVAEIAEGLFGAVNVGTAEGRRNAERSMKAGANVIYAQMRKNAGKHRKSGRTFDAIKIMNPKTARGKLKIKIGIDKIDSEFFYPAPVEFGHGGPHPAPPYPFIRPAYDEKAEEAYNTIKSELRAIIDEKTK